MCGLAGIFVYGSVVRPVNEGELLRMREAMVTRGPDGAGLWISKDRQVGLAHRRLAIIDTTAAGAQPMSISDRALCIVYNGEIYNYRKLRKRTAGQGLPLRHPKRYRGAAAFVPRVWTWDGPSSSRDVCLCAMGRRETRSVYCARSFRYQATVLLKRRGYGPSCITGQSTPGEWCC